MFVWVFLILFFYQLPTVLPLPRLHVPVSLAWGRQVSPGRGRELGCNVGQLVHATSSLSHVVQGFGQLEDLGAHLSLAVSS